MTKGLQRSLSRGPKAQKQIVKETITLTATAISVVGATGVGFGSAVIGDFPEGNINFMGAVASLTFSGGGADAALADTWAGDYGIGTTPADDATISAADVNIIQSTAIAAATAEVSPATRGTHSAGAVFDNTDGSLEINLNLLIDDADISGTSPITVAGSVVISYVVLGDD